MLFFDEYFERTAEGKNAAWGEKMVTQFRSYWRPLVSQKKAEEGMKIIMSQHDMENVMKMFKNPQKLGMEFLPIAIMEKLRNVLIGERVKAGISVSMNALDPAAEDERKGDETLLKNRAEIEGLISYMQRSIGLPDYKLSEDQPYKGNVDMFDKLGLDADSEYQVAYFFQVWHRLLHEMDAQFIVNFFMEYNEVKDYIDKWVNDIMAKKAIAAQAYVNDITGAIDIKYLAPESVFLIPGKRNDGKDAICLGYEEIVTVSDMLARMGSEFDFDRDWQYLLLAVNWNCNQTYTGIWDGTGDGCYGGKDNAVTWDQFSQFKVKMGYIEWKSWVASAKKVGKDYHGNVRIYDKIMDDTWTGNEYCDDPEMLEPGQYVRHVSYDQYTYKSFYLATTTSTQRLFKFGKLYRQLIEGAEDEYSNYSMFFKKEAGPTIAEIAKPWLEMAQECFAKIRWMVRKAKPKGRAYNYESLVKVGQRMIKSNNPAENVSGVIKLFEEGINEIFTIPESSNGEKLGGGVNPNYDLPNGLDQTTLQFRDIIQWCVQSIKNDIDMTQLREGYNPKPNDGLQLQQEAKAASENSTNYIGEMIDSVLRNSSRYTLLLTQDIIQYKDAVAYRFLLKAIGKSSVARIAQLGNVALHRYGIFINSFNTYMQRQKVMQDTDFAFQNKLIPYHVKLLIDAIDDFRKAAYILSFEQLRAEKQMEKMEQQKHDNLQALEDKRHGNKMAEIDLEGKWHDKSENTRGWWNFRSFNAGLLNDKELKQMGIDHEADKQNDRADAQVRQMAAKANLENQRPLA